MTRLNRFRKCQRIVRGSDFSLILRRGACAADGSLVVFAVASDPANTARIGITIPKRTGNAVLRNRWKRLIRESFRVQQSAIPKGYDLVIRPKKGAQPSWPDVQRSVPRLAKKAIARL